MPKRKEPELDYNEQFKRFVEVAREHEVDESGKPLREAFDKLKAKNSKTASVSRRGRRTA